MTAALAGLVALVALAWGWDVPVGGPSQGSLAWSMRQQALYLSGSLSIALLSFAMLLAARPAWLEAPLGGMDRMYRTHKWAGILAAGFAALHWLIEMSDDVLKALVGREGRVREEKYAGFLEVLRDLAEDTGEWGLYAVLAMLAITLWKRFPYRPWRFLHRMMPALYLLLAFHAVLLAPSGYWTQPMGWLLGALVAAGVYGSAHSLAGRIGRSRQVGGTIVSVERSAPDVVAVRCRLDAAWPGHRAGQFAFITFDAREGPHPFTIASADQGDRLITFQIKALGDYTGRLARELQAGQALTAEGPYGRFHVGRGRRQAQQFWIAAGIGVTPFLAWLEALQAEPARAPAAELHYCTRDRESDPFIARLRSLCAALPSIRLHVHGSLQGEVLDAAMMAAGKDRSRPAEVWFCGPRAFARGLRDGLRESWHGKVRFHQEAFEMR